MDSARRACHDKVHGHAGGIRLDEVLHIINDGKVIVDVIDHDVLAVGKRLYGNDVLIHAAKMNIFFHKTMFEKSKCMFNHSHD